MTMQQELEKQFGRKINKIFFIAIGGSSMSGLAGIALRQGFAVEGSDMVQSSYTADLEAHGVMIHIGHSPENIQPDVDLVVYSAAIHADNPDMVRADSLGIPKAERSEFLGFLSHIYPVTVGISGTHGKTTTSSMIADLLTNAGRTPCVSIGGRAEYNEGDYFVVESCEYVDSFLKTSHSVGIITNIEEDHLDYFTGGLPQIKESFHKFGRIIPEYGRLIVWGDSRDVLDAAKDMRCPVMTYGLKETNDLVAKNITYNAMGRASFEAWYKGELYGEFSLQVPGEHNVENALAVIGTGIHLGIDKEVTEKTLDSFLGAHRRFELVGNAGGINIYEDYAHHPTELKVVVQACLKLQYRKLWVVFQPHTYSRTFYFLNEFADAFEGADEVIMNDIYSDREANLWNVYSEDVIALVKERFHVPARVISKFEDIVSYLKDNAKPGDLILVAGSQTINRAAYMLAEEEKKIYEPGS